MNFGNSIATVQWLFVLPVFNTDHIAPASDIFEDLGIFVIFQFKHENPFPAYGASAGLQDSAFPAAFPGSPASVPGVPVHGDALLKVWPGGAAAFFR